MLNKYQKLDFTNDSEMVREGIRVPKLIKSMIHVIRDYPKDVKKAKLAWKKSQRNPIIHQNGLDEIIKTIVSYSPNWNLILKI